MFPKEVMVKMIHTHFSTEASRIFSYMVIEFVSWLVCKQNPK